MFHLLYEYVIRIETVQASGALIVNSPCFESQGHALNNFSSSVNQEHFRRLLLRGDSQTVKNVIKILGAIREQPVHNCSIIKYREQLEPG